MAAAQPDTHFNSATVQGFTVGGTDAGTAYVQLSGERLARLIFDLRVEAPELPPVRPNWRLLAADDRPRAAPAPRTHACSPRSRRPHQRGQVYTR